MGRIDLHSHTTVSDGLLSPRDLVRAAHRDGVTILAVTDHDTLAGLPEALEEGTTIGVEIVAGVEVTANCEGLEIHILGLCIDPSCVPLREFLLSSQRDRVERITRMAAALTALGFPVTPEEVLARATHGSVGRPHLAAAMVERGYVRSVSEAFDLFLSSTGKAYVERPRVPSAVVIERIREAGGIPILAHPGVYKRDTVIPLLVEQGLGGIEVYHPDHTPADVARYEALCGRPGLLATGGSDFHGAGSGVTSVRLGVPSLPAERYAELKRAATEQRTVCHARSQESHGGGAHIHSGGTPEVQRRRRPAHVHRV